MELNNLINSVGRQIVINRIQIYTDKTKVVECIQGILKEIKTHSIVVEQCFIDQDYVDNEKHTTIRELVNNEFVLTQAFTSAV